MPEVLKCQGIIGDGPCKFCCTKDVNMRAFMCISDFEVLKWLCMHRLMDLDCNRAQCGGECVPVSLEND